MFQKRSSKRYYIDNTLNTNKYELPLTTVIVSDEFHRGYQAAWLISNHTNELTLRTFLDKSRFSDSFRVNVSRLMTTVQGGMR